MGDRVWSRIHLAHILVKWRGICRIVSVQREMYYSGHTAYGKVTHLFEERVPDASRMALRKEQVTWTRSAGSPKGVNVLCIGQKDSLIDRDSS
jgi:hypothetical protein